MLMTITCVGCPRSCDIEATVEEGRVAGAAGAACAKGLAFVEEEIVAPKRNVSSSVLVLGGEGPLAPVRVTRPIPRERIFDLIDEIRKCRVAAPIVSRQVLIRRPLDLDCDLVATSDVELASAIQRKVP